MKKKAKIKKMVVLDNETNEMLLLLSEQTNYNHSEIVNIAIKKLNSSISNKDIRAELLDFNSILETTINLLSKKLINLN